MNSCNGPNPSPINLSQSTAKPCTNLCDLVMDEAYATNAMALIDPVGLALVSRTNLGSCKFNGQGYTCDFVVVNHPSRHTIENIQADAEVIAHFVNPVGKVLEVSSLIRVNPTETEASRFLNTFIPYANPNNVVQVALNNWSLSMMVPPNATFYSYEGSDLGCRASQKVVFGSMINIDSNTFALLVKNSKPISVAVQPLGNREVYFNSGDKLPGPSMPNDGKIYMRLRPASGNKGKSKSAGVKPVSQPDIASIQADEESKNSTVGGILRWTQDQAGVNGWFSIINIILLMISFGCAVYFSYMYSDELSSLLMLNDKAREFGKWFRSFFIRGSSSSSTPSVSSSLSRGVSSSSLIPAQPIRKENSSSSLIPSATSSRTSTLSRGVASRSNASSNKKLSIAPTRAKR